MLFTLAELRMRPGSVFHNLGAATEKAQSPERLVVLGINKSRPWQERVVSDPRRGSLYDLTISDCTGDRVHSVTCKHTEIIRTGRWASGWHAHIWAQGKQGRHSLFWSFWRRMRSFWDRPWNKRLQQSKWKRISDRTKLTQVLPVDKFSQVSNMLRHSELWIKYRLIPWLRIESEVVSVTSLMCYRRQPTAVWNPLLSF